MALVPVQLPGDICQNVLGFIRNPFSNLHLKDDYLCKILTTLLCPLMATLVSW